ncbi:MULTISPECIES: hypothetical protein [Pseudomonas]|jgi:hypothetical protein|uniref:hypothetical protein n=1 Tax=Pseudomonas TaxID=286 RepID=UPI0018D8C755|nr:MULTISPECIES: hypothetical protein [Pseudomonas]MBH3373466.1 hypothetical protein [Pseudomonas juntendi]MBS6036476.1 hypothetical protein [Pseudomonas sp.]CAH0650305.1 hypothetical protein PSNVIR_04596 [Pseudomonas sp. Nvir]
MSYTAPLTALYLVGVITVGSFALDLMHSYSDVERSAMECIRETSLTMSSECDKALVAKAKLLQAKASIFLPRS